MITTEELKQFLEIDLVNTSKDELLKNCIKSAVSEISGLTNRLLEFGKRRELINGTGDESIFLKNYPVNRITKLQYKSIPDFTDLIIPPDSIENTLRFTDWGELTLSKNYVFFEGDSNILIEYEAGYLNAAEWKGNTEYASGVYISYAGTIYLSIEAHISSDTFDETYWAVTNISAVPDDLIKTVKYLAAKQFFDSPAGRNILMKKAESFGGSFSRGIVYRDPDLENIIQTYKKHNS